MPEHRVHSDRSLVMPRLNIRSIGRTTCLERLALLMVQIQRAFPWASAPRVRSGDRFREGCIRPFCTALLQDVGQITALRLREAAVQSTLAAEAARWEPDPPPIFGKSFPLRSSDPKLPRLPASETAPEGTAEMTSLRGKGQNPRGARVEQGTARSPVSAATWPGRVLG